MFWTFSMTNFGSPEYHWDKRVQTGNYIEANSSYFEDLINGDFNQYVSLIRDTDY